MSCTEEQLRLVQGVAEKFNLATTTLPGAEPFYAMTAHQLAQALESVRGTPLRVEIAVKKEDIVKNVLEAGGEIGNLLQDALGNAEKLGRIHRALLVFHDALRARRHGSIAACELARVVEEVFDLPYRQELEAV